MIITVKSQFKQLRSTPQKKFFGASTKSLKPRKTFFPATLQLLKLQFNCDGHILISFVFSQFTSFHSVFHSFHGLMNSINWPASSVWVFIAQLVEHCNANAESTNSNPGEAPINLFFFGLPRNFLIQLR